MQEEEPSPTRATPTLRLPADFSPEALARMTEIGLIVETTIARIPRERNEFAESAPVFDLHVRAR